MKFTTLALALCALAMCWFPTRSMADGEFKSEAGCPDRKASEVEARVEWSTEVTTCHFGVSLFGLQLGVFGPDCPDAKFSYPAHQECRGETNEGTYCVVTGNLEVTKEKCECVDGTLLQTGLMIPNCDCSPAGNAGHVEDAQTMTCAGGSAG